VASLATITSFAKQLREIEETASDTLVSSLRVLRLAPGTAEIMMLDIGQASTLGKPSAAPI
jgi:hypothetical protein